MGVKRLYLVGLGLAAALLLGSYWLAGYWQAGPALSAVALIAWAAGRRRPGWLPSALLAAYVAAAAGGVLLGVSPALLIAGVAGMLVSWELAGSLDARQDQRDSLPDGAPAGLLLLFASVGTGLLIAEAGLLARLRLPFGLVVLAGVLALYGLYRLARARP